MIIALMATLANAYEVAYAETGDPHAWPTMPVYWQAHPSARPAYIGEGDSNFAMYNAVAAWEEVDQVDISFVPVQPGNDSLVRNHISWTTPWPYPDDQLALATRWVTTDGRIQSFEIFVNAEREDWATDGFGHDLQAALTHEVGHGLGLEHSMDAEATMYPTTDEREVYRRYLATDDRQGARFLYPPFENLGCQVAPAAQHGGWLAIVPAALMLFGRRRRQSS